MCSLAEMEANVAQGTGCMVNFRYIWTSTPCGHNEDGVVTAYYTARGSVKSTHPAQCVPRSWPTQNVACCADKDPHAAKAALIWADMLRAADSTTLEATTVATAADDGCAGGWLAAFAEPIHDLRPPRNCLLDKINSTALAAASADNVADPSACGHRCLVHGSACRSFVYRGLNSACQLYSANTTNVGELIEVAAPSKVGRT